MDIYFLDEKSRADWDAFCQDSDDAWFWHTTKWLDYTVELRPSLKTEQRSFYFVKNNKIVAICPLLINNVQDKNKEIRFFSYDQSHGVVPAISNTIPKRERERILKLAFSRIDTLAMENNIDYCMMKFPALSLSKERYYYLEKCGFLNTTLSSTVVNLFNDLDYILLDMRKGHRYNIRKGMEVYTVDIFDKNTITRELFDCYQYLHYKAAGRMTRPQITFDLMYSWVQTGNALLAGLKYNREYLGFALILLYKNGAYYGSACDDPEVEVPIPFGPLLQYQIIEYLKKDGYQHYELGLQQFGNQLYDFPNEKDKSISFFKRGFGGDLIPVFSGEKFYSERYFREKMGERIEEYYNRTFRN